MSKSKKPHHFQVKDPYYYEAKKRGFRARSAFKLLEIDEKYNIIQPGMNILDIASAPGSFLQVIAQKIKENGMVFGVDIQQIKPLGRKNVIVAVGDVFSRETIDALLDKYSVASLDLITSDIAPSTTGMTGVDQYRSIELNLAILDIADTYLHQWGNLLLKVFVGEDVQDLIGPIKERYMKLTRIKPKACRDRSFEEYFLCSGKKEKLAKKESIDML